MSIENNEHLSLTLRKFADEVVARFPKEPSDRQYRLAVHLGELLLIAGDMAAELDGLPRDHLDFSDHFADLVFDGIVEEEWPDGAL